MSEESAERDRMVASMAARQFGNVTTKQLADAGITKDGIYTRVNRGWLHLVHRGVYAVGAPNTSIEGRYLAAVLACGERAVLSHRSAASHWKLLSHHSGDVHVTIPDKGSRRRRRGIHVHRSSVLRFEEVTRRQGIPITNPRRTLADLRRYEAPEVARRAARQAAVLGLNTGNEAEEDRTRSELERRMLWLFCRHRLPEPEVDVRVGNLVVDFLLRDAWVVVETDGWRYHRGRAAFEDDRSRDVELRQLGFEVLRFSYRQVFEEPGLVVTSIRAAIESRTALFSSYERGKRREKSGPASR